VTHQFGRDANQTQRGEDMAAISQTIDYCDGDTQLSGLLFTDPAQARKRPGLLVVHHAGGLDDHTKSHSRSFAELGFVVFACDMYGRGIAGHRQQTTQLLPEMRDNPAKLVARARAGLDVLSAHPLVDGRLAAIGYCFGGMTVLQLARSGMALAGVVSVHGSLATVQPAAPGAVSAKVLVCHGALDPHVPLPHVTTFVEEMREAGADWQLIVYGGAMHGFTHQATTRMPGVAYNHAADARSTVAIKNFFLELFGQAD
jgi:dienelactone hydrolase